MANPFTELARLFFRVSVNRDEVKAELREVEQAAVQTAARTEAAAGAATTKASEGARTFGQRLKDSVRGSQIGTLVTGIGSIFALLTRTLGIIGLIGGAVAGLVAAVRYLGSEGDREAARLKAQRDTLQEIRDLHLEIEAKRNPKGDEAELVSTRKDLAEVQDSINKGLELERQKQSEIEDIETRLNQLRFNPGLQGPATESAIRRLESQINQKQAELDAIIKAKEQAVKDRNAIVNPADVTVNDARMKRWEEERQYRLETERLVAEEGEKAAQRIADIRRDFNDFSGIKGDLKQIAGLIRRMAMNN